MSQDFRSFDELARWRRDVRRFRTEPVASDLLDDILAIADLSPSVGNSQPWRIVEVRDREKRAAIANSFARANEAAASVYDDERLRHYRSLKLAGFDCAPIQLAIYCEPDPTQGHGLGRQTMPEMLPYSCVSFVTTLWYAARARGLGLGWVSIIRPDDVAAILDVPPDWSLIGYLLIGWPEEEHQDPELERAGWQQRTPLKARRIVR
jgi:5,6-dimethylbenzimidazole synthase